MSIPKRLSTGVRYVSAGEFNCQVTFTQPNAGAEGDGTPHDETVVKANVWAKVSQWRGKESDKAQERTAVSSYKMSLRYPKTFSVDTGMNILLRGQRHNIESFADPDGQRVQLDIWTWVENDAVSN
jgi:SPP1 family predicted phage head-tail adaptor